MAFRIRARHSMQSVVSSSTSFRELTWLPPMDTVSAMSCNVLSRGASFGGGAIRDMPLSPKCGAWDACGDELDPLKRRADGDSGSRAIHPLPLLRLVGDIRLERLVYRTCSPAAFEGRP